MACESGLQNREKLRFNSSHRLQLGERMISFMGVEYRKVFPDGSVHDVLGVFENNELKRTARCVSAKEFIELKKRPRTIKGALRVISQFNKSEING